MSVVRHTLSGGKVRYRARVKWHGSEIASRVFDRRAEAVAWEHEQQRRLRAGEWIDPRRGRIQLQDIADGWLATRATVKRRTAESDRAAWRLYIAPRFARRPVNSITTAEVREWLAALVVRGLAVATVNRALSTLRSILAHAVADGRIMRNPAASAKAVRGRSQRPGRNLSADEVEVLHQACQTRYADVVLVLAFTGLRWGELAGLQIGDLVSVPGRGLRVQRTILASGGGGELYADSTKSGRDRTVPLITELHPVIDAWVADRGVQEPLFPSPQGGPLRESNWKRTVHWTDAKTEAGLPDLRIHDLRHTAASLWIAAGADVKVVQRILGHATATMTIDLYGHLFDESLWTAAKLLDERRTRRKNKNGGTTGARKANHKKGTQ